jgi:CubicO group peptidase (beta-lactamase class C family)
MDMGQTSNAVRIHGECEPRFAAVKAALAENFARHAEIGSAVCVYHEGKKVVDLWAGHMDAARSDPWQSGTLCLMYSIAKSMSALALHILADEGKVDLEAPVTRYWPQFGQAGKGHLKVRHIVSHYDGLWATDAAEPGDVYDWARMIHIIEQQPLVWPVETKGAYDTVNIGFKAGEIVRRVSGRTIQQFVHERICGPLGAKYYLGVPEEKLALCADLSPNANLAPRPANVDPNSPQARAHRCSPRPFGTDEQNSRRFRTGGVASFGGFGEARAMARIYAALAEGGTLDGVKLLSKGAIERATRQQWSDIKDGLLGMPMAMGLGFMLPPPGGEPLFGPWADGFGHLGSGGARAVAVPSRRLAICFVSNYQSETLGKGVRTQAIVDAACAAVA